MSRPVFSDRDALPFNDLLESKQPWEDLDKLFKPSLAEAPLQPSDDVAINLALFAQSAKGRLILEWIMDITLRAPLRACGSTFEETALKTAQRQGINGVAEAILNAINHGEALLEQRKSK